MANPRSFGGGASFPLGKSEEATGLNGKLKEGGEGVCLFWMLVPRFGIGR